MNSRWEDSQKILWNIKTACFFLTLLSVAEDYNIDMGKKDYKVDLLDAAKESLKKGWIQNDYTVLYDVKILSYLTGKKVTKKVVTDCGVLKANEYSVMKYLDKDKVGNHFRRRYFDVYNGSQTVKYGTIMCYYIYTIG